MSDVNKFIKEAKKDMPVFIKQAIDNLLKKLNSEIQLPENNNGKVIEGRLLKVVQSREQVYISVCELMDMVNIDKSIDVGYKNRIIEGMMTTWHELTRIIVRKEPFDDDFINNETFNDDDESDYDILKDSVSDDHFSSISKSIVIASKLAKQIIDRVALLEDPNAVNDEKLNNSSIVNIIEQFADEK